MGQLKDRRIVQSRIWYDPNQAPMPSYDYDYSYPVTVYDAVHRTMEDDSTTLTEELDSIYRLINAKQDIIDAGTAGQIMTWTGMRGQIGALDLARTINSDPALRSHQKVPTERAIGDSLDSKVNLSDYNNHVNDNSIHLSDIERIKWNSMAPLSTVQAHIANTEMHITEKERGRWNAKADQTDLEAHIYDMNNPHNTTAHQVGTYTRREIDDMFEKIRESFFNYVNISWDDRTNQASLVEYNPANWNPNYVLKYDEELPDVEDPTLTYFALKPSTDYKTNESDDCIIYNKRPGLTWQEVGFQSMSSGDMVIQYPNTTMFVWVQGRFLRVYTGDIDQDSGTVIGTSNKVWKPSLNENGELIWELTTSKDAPDPMVIKGKDGYSPIKGVDYVDGKNGEGVAVGGLAGQMLVKLTDENYDTTWKSLADILSDFAIAGGDFPEGVIKWEDIANRPEWYDELGDNTDGFITQRAATHQFEVVNQNITEILSKLSDYDDIRQNIYDHLNDFNNPHRVTAAQIGAVSNATYLDHVQNFNNPHNVTAELIGLGNVNNTSDLDKPISTATQAAIDDILSKLGQIDDSVDKFNYISSVTFDSSACDLTFIFRDKTELLVHIPIVDVFNTIYYDQEEKELVIVLPDGTENRVDLSDMIKSYYGSNSSNIQVVVENDNTIKATILPGTVGELEIAPSVHLRQSPTTTTQPTSDRSTRIATTEFVRSIIIDNLISYETDRPLSANMGRILNERKVDMDDLIQIINDLEGIDVIDNLDSTNPLAALSANMGRYLDLTKAPRVHTSPDGATYGRATVSLFGHVRASDMEPLMDGTVFKGTDNGYYAREDHRHPTDSTRAPMHWPDVEHNQYELTGEPKAVNPPDDSNDHRIATTEWVRRNAVGVQHGICTTSKTNPNKVVTLKSTYMDPVVFIRQIGSTVSVLFSKEDRSGSTPTTLNVNDTGEAKILFAGKALTNGMIGTNHEHMFVFDGEYWRLINPVPGTGMEITIGPSPDEDDPIPKVIDKQSGYMGYTLKADGDENSDGEVNRVYFTIQYQPLSYDPVVTLSEYEDAFAARMGDGTNVLLNDGKVISTTRSSCVIQFTMAKYYPSNSPCQLIYRLNQAWISVGSENV